MICSPVGACSLIGACWDIVIQTKECSCIIFIIICAVFDLYPFRGWPPVGTWGLYLYVSQSMNALFLLVTRHAHECSQKGWVLLQLLRSISKGFTSGPVWIRFSQFALAIVLTPQIKRKIFQKDKWHLPPIGYMYLIIMCPHENLYPICIFYYAGSNHFLFLPSPSVHLYSESLWSRWVCLMWF